jgi:hypothetical protein
MLLNKIQINIYNSYVTKCNGVACVLVNNVICSRAAFLNVFTLEEPLKLLYLQLTVR